MFVTLEFQQNTGCFGSVRRLDKSVEDSCCGMCVPSLVGMISCIFCHVHLDGWQSICHMITTHDET